MNIQLPTGTWHATYVHIRMIPIFLVAGVCFQLYNDVALEERLLMYGAEHASEMSDATSLCLLVRECALEWRSLATWRYLDSEVDVSRPGACIIHGETIFEGIMTHDCY